MHNLQNENDNKKNNESNVRNNSKNKKQHISEYDKKNATKKRNEKAYNDGKYFEDVTDKFYDAVVKVLCEAPIRLQKYVLDPVFEAVESIATDIGLANAVYMNQKDKNELFDAYCERIEYLQDALRMFRVFDKRFASFLSQYDLMKSEYARIIRAVTGIMLKNGCVLDGEINGNGIFEYDGKSDSIDGDELIAILSALVDDKCDGDGNDCADSGKHMFESNREWSVNRSDLIGELLGSGSNVPVSVRVYRTDSEYIYESANGNVSTRIGLTKSDKNRILLLRNESRDAIAERLSKDRKQLSVLSEKIAGTK